MEACNNFIPFLKCIMLSLHHVSCLTKYTLLQTVNRDGRETSIGEYIKNIKLFV